MQLQEWNNLLYAIASLLNSGQELLINIKCIVSAIVIPGNGYLVTNFVWGRRQSFRFRFLIQMM